MSKHNADPAPLVVGGRQLGSRLMVGTGRFKSTDEAVAAINASGAEVVTVAVRRVDLGGGSILDALDLSHLHLLPNTSGCASAQEAVRTAQLAREALETNLVKLEVVSDLKTLLPDVVETVQATETLAAEGFDVMVYTTDDLGIARRLVDAGAAAVMPLAAPIGSGMGLQDPYRLELLIDEIRTIPVIVDAGVGVPSHAAEVMELGADGVLMNTGIAAAQDPVRMAHAMRLAIEAGRLAYLSRPMEPLAGARASSPQEGVIGT